MNRLILAIMLVVVILLSQGVWTPSVFSKERQGDVLTNDLPQQLQELTEGKARISTHAKTGKVRFIGTELSNPIPQPAALRASANPEQAARGFLSRYGELFGLANQSRELTVMRSRTVDDGRSFVRFQQVYEGIPIMGGGLIVQVTSAGNSIISANGEILPDISLDTIPTVSASSAEEAALGVVAREYSLDPGALRVSEPELWIYNPIILGMDWDLTTLVWRMEVESVELLPIRELVLVDARLGFVALRFNQVPTAKDRQVYTAFDGADCTDTIPGWLQRSEGQGPTGYADVDYAYDYSGYAYDFYWTEHGRDSIDNAGMTIISTVDWDPDGGCDCQNAFWNGTQMVYGTGFASAADVVAHELTHGVTSYESNLFYFMQSGAIDEGFSDIWGELIELTYNPGQEEDRWLCGEDLPIGALRDMQDPTAFGDPDRMTSTNYYCGELDNGGVHRNSGVANKAAYLMVDGDTFNGYVVTGMGISKTADVWYEVQTNLFTSAGDYADLYDCLQQAAINLGYSAADRQTVEDAVNATEMNLQPPSCPSPEAPVCDAGEPFHLFFDDLENPASGNWVSGTIVGSNHWVYPDSHYATSGQYNFWGYDYDDVADYYMAMTFDVPLPAGSQPYLHFKHAYVFDYDILGTYDGGVLEYSTDAGSSWNDAGALFTHNGYTGTIATGWGNPLGGRSAFVNSTRGYISSRFDLSSLAGQSVRFRFRIGTDSIVSAWGWFIDDIRIYTCSLPEEIPDIRVEPPSFDVPLPPDDTWEGTLEIWNDGDAPLTYDITDVETTPAGAAAAVTVSIDVPVEVGEGTDFIARVDITEVTNLNAANYDITYDPLILEVTDVTDGLIGGTVIPVDMWGFIPAGTQGTIRIIEDIPGLPGVSGSGYLAEIHFHVVGSAGNTSAITLSNGILSDNTATETPATWVGDSVDVNTALNPGSEEGITYPNPPQANGGSPLEAFDRVSGVSRTYETPAVLAGETEIAYDDGSAEGAWTVTDIGLGSVFAVCFTPPEYPAKVKTARFLVYDAGVPATPIKIHIYEQATGSSPPGAELIPPFIVTPPGPGWFDVDLSGYDIVIGSGSFAIGEEPTVAYSVVLGEDQAAPDYRSWAYDIQTLEWQNWAEEISPGDLMIRAIVETAEEDCPWLDEEPKSGEVPAGECDVITVSIDTTGMAPGEYSANIVIANNDPDEDPTIVPVNLTVGLAPDIRVEPPSFDVPLPPDDTWEGTLEIWNDGGAPLNYDIETTAAMCTFINGGFETGDFTGWNTVTGPGAELTPWNVSAGGTGFFGNGFPAEGTFFAQNGFDGEAGLYYDIYQEVAIPAGATWALLSWSERIQWDLTWGALPRLYEVTIQLAGGGAPLATLFTMTLDPGTFGDTGYVPHSVDLLSAAPGIAGSTVRINWHEEIPETFTGPAQFDLDAICLIFSSPWLDEEPKSGEVPAGECDVITVSIDTTGMAPGEYSANIVIANNDPDEDPTIVPVNLTVEEITEVLVVVEDAIVAIGHSDSVDIWVRNFPEDEFGLGCYTIRIDYDPTMIEVTGVSPGDAPFDVPTYNIYADYVSITQFIVVMPGPTGDIRIADLEFTCLAEGETTLALTIETLANTNGDGILATPINGTITQQGNLPPTPPEVDVTPDFPLTTDDLVCSIITESVDPEGQPVTYTYEWYKDDVIQPDETTITTALTDTVSSDLTAEGEVWRCVVTPNDGYVDGPPGEDQVTIGNSPPWIEPVIPDQSADEDVPISIDLTLYENDLEDSGTALDWSAEGLDHCTVSGEYSDDDVLTFTPDADFVGDDVVSLILHDSGGLTDSQDVTLTWNDVTPPYTSGHDPAAGATGVPVDTNIVVHVLDDGEGVDDATIAMTVEGAPVSPTITGTPADYTLTYDPPADFDYGQEVNVTVDASDLAGNPMTTDSYYFTTVEEPDTNPPYTSGHDPAAGATDVPIDTNIVVHVLDDGEGVDDATVAMTVEGAPVSPTITGTPADYTLTYDPPADFDYGQEVNVTVDASDLAGNPMTTDSYYFTTIGNTPPWIEPVIPDQSADEDVPISIDLTPYENDLEDSGTALDWSAEGLDHCTVSGEYSDDDVLTFTPDANFVGDDVVSLILHDSGGLTDSQDVTLTWNDITPPYTSGHDPAAGATGVPVDTNIVVHVLDDGEGVDDATIAMTVEGAPVSPTITGTPADYTLTYDPPADFDYGQEVNVTVDASDLAGNPMTTDSYYFTCEEDSDGDGVPDIEEQGPDGSDEDYDGNEDGTPDSQQGNVASLHTYDGEAYVTIASPDALKDVQAVDNPSPEDAPPGIDFPYGFLAFTIDGVGIGGATTVTLHLPDGASPTTYHKYGPTPSDAMPDPPHWYEFSYDDQTGAEISGNIITLHFVDGQRGDDDYTANGTIVEPGGPGQPPPPPPPSGGGGGGAPRPRGPELEVDMMGRVASGPITEEGELEETINVTSRDGVVTLRIDEGTIALDSEDNRLEEIMVDRLSEWPEPPESAYVIGSAYDFGPDGATFDSSIGLTISCDPEELPEGVNEEDLVIAYYHSESGEWRLLPSVVDTGAHTVTASIGHLTDFAIIGREEATFDCANLSISPSTVDSEESVTVSVEVTNSGGMEGSYTVTLLIDGAEEARQELTLDPGASHIVTFAVTRDEAGTYEVMVDGLSGSLTVTEEGFAWWAVGLGAGLGTLLLAAIAAYLLVWRRRRATA